METLPLISPAVARSPSPSTCAVEFRKRCLLTLVGNAVQKLAHRPLRPVFSLYNGQLLPPAEMLTLLTYCYAIGIHGSEQIEEHLSEDHLARALCAQAQPDGRSIRKFRRHNRAAVKECLAETCRFVWKLKAVNVRWIARSAGSPSRHPCPEHLDPALESKIQEEVEELLNIATFVDSMCWDDF